MPARRGWVVSEKAKRNFFKPAFGIARMLIRYGGGSRWKIVLWQRFCHPYLNWRGYQKIVKTDFQASMFCRSSDLVQQRIMFFGVWEPNASAFICRRLLEGDGFIDIGANVGYFSLLAAARVGRHGLVLAVEVAPAIFRELIANIELNGSLHVRAVNQAVSNRRGSVGLYAAPNDNIGATTTVPSDRYPKIAEIPCAPLDHIATPEELARARIVKIDAEGAEVDILSDISTKLHLFRYDVEFLVEITIAAFDASGISVEAILTRIRDAGFRIYQMPNDYSIEAYARKKRVAHPIVISELPSKGQIDLLLSRAAPEMM